MNNALEILHAKLQAGDTIYGIVRHVSATGMTRVIDFLIIKGDKPWYLTHTMGDVLALRSHAQYNGLIIHGCGMNMAFAAIYDLGRTLYPKGVPCTGIGCLSNDHSNGDRDYTPHADGIYDHTHTDGGYAFKAETL